MEIYLPKFMMNRMITTVLQINQTEKASLDNQVNIDNKITIIGLKFYSF